MRTDEDLTAWREAAATGGLPAPSLERWQALRAGVVNLWEFEAVEYWYADGWAQLMGHNETGKSSLMALTTLIPWLADTSSDKIDTLGRSGKQFSYYVRPTGTDGDRRDATGSYFHGWLWVEYGRVTEQGPRYFTTLLYASSRSAATQVKPTWCTSAGPRVREDLRLAVGREIQTPKNIELPGFTAHPTAQAYRTEVASRLLGSTVDRLERVGKILKVTRTPKLGAQLETRFVTDHLRSSLPELRRGEIEQLADGWDQLDQIRGDLQRATDAAKTVARFAGGPWRAWLGARLRLVADEAADRRTKFDNVTRDEETAASALREAEEKDKDLQQRADDARFRADKAQASESELRQSAAYRDARDRINQAQRASEAVTRLKATVAHHASAARQAADRMGTAEEEHEASRAELTRREEEATTAQDEVRRAAREAGVGTSEPQVDVDRLRQRAAERRRAVGRAEELLSSEAEANAAATRAEETAALLEAKATEAATAADEAWRSAEAEQDSLVDALGIWVRSLPDSAASRSTPEPDLAGWVGRLPRSEVDLRSASLADMIRAEWHDPRRTAIEDRRHAAESAESAVRAQIEQLTAEIDELQHAGTAPPPSPVLWHRRSRDEAAGRPFWQLVNPADWVTPDQLASMEAALAAAGVLDAWVSPDGPVGLDTFAVAPDAAPDRRRLADALRVADDAGPLGPAVQSVLDGVALSDADEMLPDSGVAVATDGRWRSSGLTGSAAPAHQAAGWIGEAAREARRRRMLEDLSARLHDARAELARRHADVVGARAELEALADALRRTPSDRELRRCITVASERDRRAEDTAAEASSAGEEARSARAVADTRRAELLRFTTDSALPHDTASLRDVDERLHALERVLVQCRHAERSLGEARARAERSAKELAGRTQEHQEQQDALRDAERELSVAHARAEALRAAVDEDDAVILQRLEQLIQDARGARDLHDSLQEELRKVAERLGGARTRLASTKSRREEATRERDEAFARFRSLVDRGVSDELDLDLPEAHSSSIEHIRGQVAELRRRVSPRGWQEGSPEDNADVLQRLRSMLEGQAREVNGQLEQGGRSLRLEPVDDLVRIDVTVDTNGRTLPLRQAAAHLAETVETLQRAYDSRVQETLDELLGSTFLEHMRERIGTAQNLIREINKVLGEHATTTTDTALRIRLNPSQNQAVLDAISGSALQNPNVQEQIRGFLRDRVDEARRMAQDQGQPDWHDALARQLDYRDWYDVELQRRIGTGGNWGPLTTSSYSKLSGGARAVMLMLPLVATLAALYRDMPGSPRPIWLDEAFDGLDVNNRTMVMNLLRQFDLDVLLVGPGRLVNIKAVPTAAIYQVVRAPKPHPGADLTLELWAGGTLQLIDLPLSWLDTTSPMPPPGQESLL